MRLRGTALYRLEALPCIPFFIAPSPPPITLQE